MGTSVAALLGCGPAARRRRRDGAGSRRRRAGTRALGRPRRASAGPSTITGTSRFQVRPGSPSRRRAQRSSSEQTTRSGRVRSASASASPPNAAWSTWKPSLPAGARGTRVAGSGSASSSAAVSASKVATVFRAERCPFERLCDDRSQSSLRADAACDGSARARRRRRGRPRGSGTHRCLSRAPKWSAGGRRRRDRRCRWLRRRTGATRRAWMPIRSKDAPLAAAARPARLRRSCRSRVLPTDGSTSSVATAATGCRCGRRSCSSADAWRALARLPDARAAAAAAIAGGKLYVVGGIDGRVARSRGVRAHTRVEELDEDPLARARGSTSPRPPRVAASMRSAAARAGIDTNKTGLRGLRRRRASRWRRLAPLPGRAAARALRLSDGRIVLGRRRASRPARSASVYAYELGRAVGRGFLTLPTPRHGLGVVAVNDRIWSTLGGGPAAGPDGQRRRRVARKPQSRPRTQHADRAATRRARRRATKPITERKWMPTICGPSCREDADQRRPEQPTGDDRARRRHG